MTAPAAPDAEVRGADAGGVRCAGLRVELGGRTVLDGVDLHVPPGTLTALTGPSGVGKTTLLRVIAGLQPAHAGAVTVGGRDVSTTPAHRRDIGLLFQQPRLFPGLDVGENVAFALRAAGVGRRERRRQAAALLSEVGLAGYADRRVRGLSGGEQQRVALARALARAPSVLLLDEPLSALDPDRRDATRALIRDTQRQRGLSMVYVTHDRTEAAELGDRMAVLLDGRIAQCDLPRTVMHHPVSAQVAGFVGVRNLLPVEVVDGCAYLDGVAIPVGGPGGPASLAIRSERVRLRPDGPLRLRVIASVDLGTHHRLRLQGPGWELEATAERGAAIGEVVGVTLPPDAVWRLPTSGQE